MAPSLTTKASADGRRMDLSFAAKGFGLLRTVQWTLSAVIVMSMAMSGWLAWDSQRLSEQAAEYEAAANRLEAWNQGFQQRARQAGLDVSAERTKTLNREVLFMKQLAQKRNFSWTRLLSELEEAVPPRISIASVTLNFSDSRISVTGSAQTLKNLTDFVDRLEQHGSFSNVVLSQHQMSAKENGQPSLSEQRSERAVIETVDFGMTVGYRPSVPGGRRG